MYLAIQNGQLYAFTSGDLKIVSQPNMGYVDAVGGSGYGCTQSKYYSTYKFWRCFQEDKSDNFWWCESLNLTDRPWVEWYNPFGLKLIDLGFYAASGTNAYVNQYPAALEITASNDRSAWISIGNIDMSAWGENVLSPCVFNDNNNFFKYFRAIGTPKTSKMQIGLIKFNGYEASLDIRGVM